MGLVAQILRSVEPSQVGFWGWFFEENPFIFTCCLHGGDTGNSRIFPKFSHRFDRQHSISCDTFVCELKPLYMFKYITEENPQELYCYRTRGYASLTHSSEENSISEVWIDFHGYSWISIDSPYISWISCIWTFQTGTPPKNP